MGRVLRGVFAGGKNGSGSRFLAELGMERQKGKGKNKGEANTRVSPLRR
jgi:hypothetical protein